MDAILEKISRIGIVPVIKIDRIEDAEPLAKALCEGGLPVAEVTFRTEHAKQAMQIINEKFPDMILGAGTVLTTKQVDDAIEAGAKFIVSPGLNPEIVRYCQSKNVMILPGCANASDIEAALSFGLTTVKFFPAEPLGGLKMIKALAAPYVNVNFMPTGGVKENNICDYLAYDRIVACGGTWMIDSKLIANGEFDKIKELTQNAVKTMLGLKLDHVGINATPSTSEGIANEMAGPVSYTHLDVYKRQAYRSVRRCAGRRYGCWRTGNRLFIWSVPAPEAVSYTHLPLTKGLNPLRIVMLSKVASFIMRGRTVLHLSTNHSTDNQF